jgi:tetratricopeptide (TPR) repeat protein
MMGSCAVSKTIVRLAVAACLTAVVGCSAAPEGELVRTHQRALEAFDQAAGPEDYLRAAVLYQEILDRGVVSGALLYNQGNAYMRAGQRGRAIACYRRALAYRPRDPQLHANLQLALGAESAIRGPRGLLDYVFFWHDWISYPGKVRAAAALASLAFAFGILALFVPPRRVFRRAAWGTLVLTVIVAGSAAYDWHRFERIQRGVVVRAEVVARKGNADSYDPAFTEPLKEGTELRVVERRGAWLQIQLAGGQTGWVPDAAVTTY